jgi:hypothetical protein
VRERFWLRWLVESTHREGHSRREGAGRGKPSGMPLGTHHLTPVESEQGKTGDGSLDGRLQTVETVSASVGVGIGAHEKTGGALWEGCLSPHE